MLKRYYSGVKGGRLSLFTGIVEIVSTDAWVTIWSVYLFGAPGATLTIKLVTVVNTNIGGRIKANGIPKFLNDTFTVTLDAGGNGSFESFLQGNPSDSPSTVSPTWEIITTTIGAISGDVAKRRSTQVKNF